MRQGHSPALNSILGFSQLLLERKRAPLTEEQRQDVQDIACAGAHLLALINDILDISKLEAGHQRLRIAPVNPAQVIAEVVKTLRPTAADHGLELRASLEGLPTQVAVDERALRQIVLNLGSNAVKFTDEGIVEIRGVLRDDHMVIEVADTGIGIAPDQLGRILEPFTQVETGLNRAYGGTGLGLAITRELVELHGGTLEVRSVLGEGSTFAVRMPLANDSERTGEQG